MKTLKVGEYPKWGETTPLISQAVGCKVSWRHLGKAREGSHCGPIWDWTMPDSPRKDGAGGSSEMLRTQACHKQHPHSFLERLTSI